jgi:hypothetical protein
MPQSTRGYPDPLAGNSGPNLQVDFVIFKNPAQKCRGAKPPRGGRTGGRKEDWEVTILSAFALKDPGIDSRSLFRSPNGIFSFLQIRINGMTMKDVLKKQPKGMPKP